MRPATVLNGFIKAMVLTATLSLAVATIDARSSIKPVLADDGSQLVGNWTGESICVGNHPACHDEKVVYRISKTPGKPGNVTIIMDKIIDGKPEPIAELEFTYDAEKKTLVNEFTRGHTHGVWEFKLAGNTIAGVLLVLPEKTIARQVKVKKDEK
jgi:hypothetical protein